MAKWIRRIWCWITGGHRYADINLESCSFPEQDTTYFRNFCVKCGKSDTWAVSTKALYDVEHPHKKFGYWGIDDGLL